MTGNGSIGICVLFGRWKTKEYTTGFPFEFGIKCIEKENNKKYLRLNNSPIYHDGSIFKDRIILKTELNFISFNNVVCYFEEMYNKGCLSNYLQSVKEFLGISLDLELLFDAWHKTLNKEKALKLYRHSVISKGI